MVPALVSEDFKSDLKIYIEHMGLPVRRPPLDTRPLGKSRELIGLQSLKAFLWKEDLGQSYT